MKYLIVIILMSGCTSVLGDFNVDEHCKTTEQCKAGFNENSVCVDTPEKGRICRVYVEAGAD